MIARQMVDMLVESSSNVEMILKFFDMFLKLKDIVGSEAFRTMSLIPVVSSQKDFQKVGTGRWMGGGAKGHLCTCLAACFGQKTSSGHTPFLYL